VGGQERTGKEDIDGEDSKIIADEVEAVGDEDSSSLEREVSHCRMAAFSRYGL
jgi:hypothetical protein